MTEPLSLERFRALADAYGGVIARWPERERDAALRFSAHPEAVAILREAATLDATLDRWRVPAPNAALRDRIVRSAMLPGAITARARLWWSGIGVAAALAGAGAGIATVAVAAPIDIATDGGTSFGDVAAQDG